MKASRKIYIICSCSTYNSNYCSFSLDTRLSNTFSPSLLNIYVLEITEAAYGPQISTLTVRLFGQTVTKYHEL